MPFKLAQRYETYHVKNYQNNNDGLKIIEKCYEECFNNIQYSHIAQSSSRDETQACKRNCTLTMFQLSPPITQSASYEQGGISIFQLSRTLSYSTSLYVARHIQNFSQKLN